jgi:hypothetical protein
MNLLSRERFADHGQVIDYTQERIGARSRNGKVYVCPNCGQRGAAALVRIKVKGEIREWIEVTHRARLNTDVIRFWSIEKHCTVTKERNLGLEEGKNG